MGFFKNVANVVKATKTTLSSNVKIEEKKNELEGLKASLSDALDEHKAISDSLKASQDRIDSINKSMAEAEAQLIALGK